MLTCHRNYCFEDHVHLDSGVKLNNHVGFLEPPIYRNDSVDRFYYTYTAIREEQCMQVAQKLALVPNPDDFATQCNIYNEVGIDSDTLSDEECAFIIERTRLLRYGRTC